MAFCCPHKGTSCFIKTPPNHNCQPEYKMPCCSWWGCSSGTGFDCFFPVVYCHLQCVRKLVSACSGKMRHWWFGLFALLQEMWLPCDSLVLALSPASSCKCRGCDGVCAKSHYKTEHKGCAQDNTEDWDEDEHRVQLFVSGTATVLTQGQETISLPCKPRREPVRGKALKWWPSIHHALRHTLQLGWAKPHNLVAMNRCTEVS